LDQLGPRLSNGEEVRAGTRDVKHASETAADSTSIQEKVDMTRKVLVFLLVIGLVGAVACTREETRIDATTDTVLTDTSMTAGTTDTWATDTMMTDTMATDTMMTGTMGTDTMGTDGMTATSTTTGTTATTNTY
jgi:hypothetical protein